MERLKESARELIAQSRIEIGQVRLHVYKTAWLIDSPDAVHRRSIARQELRRERPFAG